jgi:hypothetical protein
MGKRDVQEPFVVITTLRSPVEAALVQSLLSGQGIPFRAVDYTDSAYDGLFRLQQGWGRIEAPERCRDLVLAVVREVRDEAADL